MTPQREQAECRDWLAEHGHEHPLARGARLGASDWLMEEVLIMAEQRWDSLKGKAVTDARVDAFIEAVIAISKQHGFSISHEDTGGAFVIEQYSEADSSWLRYAHMCLQSPKDE